MTEHEAPSPGKPSGSQHRTRWITVVSIAAVSAAGALALGANIGILDAADDSSVGTLAAAGDLTPPSTQVIDVYVTDAPAAPAVEAAGTTVPVSSGVPGAAPGQQYAVDTAGTVTVSATDALVQLDGVAANNGWTWSSAQSDAAHLTVTFTDGTRTLDFVAALNPDGSVAARVEEPQVFAAPPVQQGGGDDDEYEGGEDDD
jgi:hypothetical protein